MLPSKTVVGLFKNQAEADRVAGEVRAAGISGSSIKTVNNRELEAHEMTLTKESRAENGAGILLLLNRLFGTEHRMEFGHASALYTDWIRNGGVLVAVNTESRLADRAAKIMEGNSDAEITSRVKNAAEEREQRRETIQAVPAATSELRPRELARDFKEEEATIPVVQEELRVGKRKVQRGPVRVLKHVSETPVEETVQLRDETVTVERHGVDRLASEADLRGFTDSKIEMIETTEEAVVSKEAHVIEEITITKRAQDHEERIRDKVRRTEVDIEGLSGIDTLKQTGSLPTRELREAEFRKNFQARFAGGNRNYADYEPAYELGSSLAEDERFRGRDWASMQGEARRLWENKKSGSWNDFADAIRHGWETRRGRRAA